MIYKKSNFLAKISKIIIKSYYRKEQDFFQNSDKFFRKNWNMKTKLKYFLNNSTSPLKLQNEHLTSTIVTFHVIIKKKSIKHPSCSIIYVFDWYNVSSVLSEGYTLLNKFISTWLNIVFYSALYIRHYSHEFKLKSFEEKYGGQLNIET